MTQAWDPPSTPPSWQTGYSTPSQVPSTPKKKLEPAALTALLLALSSLVIWFIPAVIAIVLATGAKRSIKASPETRKGKEYALAAQVISLLSIVLAAGVLTLIAFF